MHLFIFARSRILNQSKRLVGFDNISYPESQTASTKNKAVQVSAALSQNPDLIRRAFYLASKDSHSGVFLTSKPNGSTELSDDHFGSALRLRLGLDQLPDGSHFSTNEFDLDAGVRHALSCQNWQGVVHRRHDLLRDTIFELCSKLDCFAEVNKARSGSDVGPDVTTFICAPDQQVSMEQRNGLISHSRRRRSSDLQLRCSTHIFRRDRHKMLDRRCHHRRAYRQKSRGQDGHQTQRSL